MNVPWGASLNGLDLARMLPAGFAAYASRGKWTSAPHLTFLSLLLCDALLRREPRLIIQMPPRCGKSTLVSQYYPVWWLGNHPDQWVLLTSYSDRFAANWGRKARDVMALHGPTVFRQSVRRDQSATDDWGLVGHTGGMSTAGVGGSLTGRGADLLIVDDPIKDAMQANSQLQRDNVWEWWQSTASTRLEPGGVAIVVQTRWHQDDLAGRLITEMEQGGEQWRVVSLPAIATENENLRAGCWTFTREQGDALWPARYPLERLEVIKRSSGSYWWAALYMQNPQPAGGAVFKREWFSTVNAMPAITRSLRFWDCGGGAQRATAQDPDPTVGTRIDLLSTGRYIISDVVRGQWNPGEVDRIIAQTAQRDGVGVPIREEQEPGSSGKAVVYARGRTLAGFDYKGIPASGDKVTRWRPFAAQSEAGNVDVLRAVWNREWFDELASVPFAAHDDQADSAAGAFNELALGHHGAASVRLAGW